MPRSIHLTEEYPIRMKEGARERARIMITDAADGDELLVVIEATHSGIKTRNNTRYRPEWMARNVTTWTHPYEKPVLAHHDKMGEPLGRVKQAMYVDTPELALDGGPDGHCELLVSVRDKSAIEKLLDGRYTTVSIGARSSDVVCSVCEVNLAEDEMCPHVKGKQYEVDGEKRECIWDIGELTYDEKSFVNVPADPHAKVKQMWKPSEFATLDFVMDGDDQPKKKLAAKATKIIADTLKEEATQMKRKRGKGSTKEKAEDLQFLANFKTVYGDSTLDVKNADQVSMFSMAHNLLHTLYDGELEKADGDKAVAEDHAAIHKFIHTFSESLNDLVEGPLDDTLSDEKAEADGEAKDPKDTKEAKSEATTPALAEATLEQILDLAIVKEHLKSLTPAPPAKDEIKVLETKIGKLEVDLQTRDSKIEELERALTESEQENEKLLSTNRESYKKLHRTLAERVVDKRIALHKPDTSAYWKAEENDRDDLRTALITSYTERSSDVLAALLEDLKLEENADKNEVEPGSVKSPAITQDEKEKGTGNSRKFKNRAEEVQAILGGAN